MTTKKNEETIVIRPLDIQRVTVRIIGDTPLIVHNWSEKAKKQMLDAMQGKKKGKAKEAKDPVAEFIGSLFWMEGMPSELNEAGFAEAINSGKARFGFPATAIKQAATAAAYRLGWIKNQAGARGAFFIEGDSNGFVEIFGSTPTMREDPVTVGMGGTDLRYRAEFKNWYADIVVSYNNSSADFTLETILNMLNAGGYCCGIGEWRPERDGTYGRFHVAGVAQ